MPRARPEWPAASSRMANGSRLFTPSALLQGLVHPREALLPPGVGRCALVVLADRFSLEFSRETQEVYGLKRKSYISDICGEALVVSYLCILFNCSNLHINTDGSYPRDREPEGWGW